MKGIILGLSMCAMATSAFAQAAVAASKIAPVENPPQFIVLGSDDNTIARGVDWMRGVLDAAGNQDGSKRRMSFYVNTRNGGGNWSTNIELATAVYNAYKAGHGIGNHTATHPYMVPYAPNENQRMGLDTIIAEIMEARFTMHANGIPSEHHFGFRTPYLRYSDSTFTAIHELGFKYDVSISASSSNEAGDAFWPYTLDGEPDENGNVSPDNTENLTRPIRNHPGLWTIPCSRIKVHPDDMQQITATMETKGYSNFDGYITGLDWNLWNEAEMDSGQTVRALMHTLEETMNGNRAPFTIGVHSQYYFQASPDFFPNITQEQRRGAFAEFVKQASEKHGVFFVSSDMVIRWVENPVSLDNFNPENFKRPAYSQFTAPIDIRLSSTRVDQGSLTVGNLTVINPNVELQNSIEVTEGGDIFEIVGNTLRLKSAQQAVGKYNITIKATSDGGSLEKDFTISVNRVLTNDIVVQLSGWSPSVDGTSNTTIGSEDGALVLTINLGAVVGDTWPYAGATRGVPLLTGVKGIEITYTADRDFNVGIGFWSPAVGFGFNAPVQGSQTLKTVIVPIEELTSTWSHGDAPGSIYDALDVSGVYVQLAATVYGQTTNLKVHSLKFRADIGNETAIRANTAARKMSPVTLTGVTASRLNLNVAQAGVYTVDIFSANGRRVFSTSANLSAGTNQIPLSRNLAKGVAIIRVSGLNTKLEQKVVIK